MRMPRRFGRLLSVVALVSVLAVVGWAPAAQARTVVHDSFSFPVDEVFEDACPFPVHFSGQVSGQVEAFYDDAGNLIKVILHFSNTFTLSANGSSLPGSTHNNQFDVEFDSAGGAPSQVIETGLFARLRLPDGGTVSVEAGRIVTDVATDTIVFQAGNFDNPRYAAAVCAALS
jgi:hypothetical protein